MHYSGSDEGAAETARIIQLAGGEAVTHGADITKREEVGALFEALDKAYQRLDIVVNTAGVSGGGPLSDLDDAQLAQIIGVNLLGPLYVASEAARRLGDGGRIINFSSTTADFPPPGSGIYSGSKLAIRGSTDISKRGEVESAANQLRAAFGPIVIVVNNAGITEFRSFLKITEEEWDNMLSINAKRTLIITQTVLPHMMEAKWGRIVAITSSGAQPETARMTHYSASKDGMIALTMSLAQEFGPHGITSNNIPPRFIMGTVMSEKSAADGKFGESLEPLIHRRTSAPFRRRRLRRRAASAAGSLSS